MLDTGWLQPTLSQVPCWLSIIPNIKRTIMENYILLKWLKGSVNKTGFSPQIKHYVLNKTCFLSSQYLFYFSFLLLNYKKRQFKSYINDQKKNVPDNILKVPASSMQMIFRLKHTLSLNIRYFLFYQLLQWSDSLKAALELK